MRSFVLALLQIGHDALDDVWLRAEEIDGFDIAVRRSPVGDDFDVGDALVENRVVVEDIVQHFLAIGVENQHFPVTARDLSDRVEQDWNEGLVLQQKGGDETTWTDFRAAPR